MTSIGTHFTYEGDFSDLALRIESSRVTAFQTYLSTRQNSWWPSKVEDFVAESFQDKTSGKIGVAHAPFVFNILTDPSGYRYSNNQWKGLLKYLNLATKLGLHAVVVHPGSAKGTPSEKAMAFAIYYLQQVFSQYEGTALLCLENSANLKTGPAANFKELIQIVDYVKDPRLALCLDTTHAFAAGIDLRLQPIRDKLIDNIQDHVEVVHFNQPLPEVTCGSFRDRHSSLIDEGPLGELVMKAIWHRLKDKPLILEGTPDLHHDLGTVEEWNREASLV